MNAPRATDAARDQLRVFVGAPTLTEARARDFLEQRLGRDGSLVDLEIARLPQDSIDDALDSLTQVGMFSSVRGLWLRNLGSQSAAENERLLERLEADFPLPGVIVATARRLDQRGRLWKWLVKRHAVEDLRLAADKQGRFKKEDVAALIRSRAALAGVSVSSQAVAAICERCGSDADELLQEIDKLCLACEADAAVDLHLVESLMRDQRGVWMYSLTDAIGRRCLRDAEEIVERLLERGEHPLRLVAAMANHVAELIEIRAAAESLPRAALRNAGAFARDYFPKLPAEVRSRFRSPFRAFHQFAASRRFHRLELRAMHRGLLRIDLQLKSSRLPPRHLISEFLAGACATKP